MSTTSFGQRRHGPREDFRPADRVEITDLVHRFPVAMDLRDREMFEDCFVDPVLWDVTDSPGPLTGGPADREPTTVARSELVRRAVPDHGGTSEDRSFTQHKIDNVLVTFTGDASAEVFAYLRMDRYTYPGTAESATLQVTTLAGFYHPTVVRVGARWQISALRLAIRGYDPALFVGGRAGAREGTR
jgi:hypothetical protein